jgi:alpha-tubulin suppressor-like RCC1 family protein
MGLRLLASGLALAALAACYRPSFERCAVRCSDSTGCPADQTCLTDGFCHASTSEAMCGGADGDGGLPDGTPGPDGAPDAMVDPLAAAAVTTGDRHTCAIDANGRLWCWGENGYGSLGADNTVLLETGTPRPVDFSTDWVRVDAGGETTCGIRGTTLYCWGANGFYQTGVNTDGMVPTPMPVMGGGDYKEVSVGGGNACAIRTNGELYCWGGNQFGQLGDGTGMMFGRVMPGAVLPGDAPSNAWKSVSVGDAYACAIHENGQLYCWGEDNEGRLGVMGIMFEAYAPRAVTTTETAWKSVSAGQHSTCAVTVSGKLYCWGGNDAGQLGLPASTTIVPTPARIGTDSDWDSVSLSLYTTCGTRGGMVLCSGDNSTGAVGAGDWRSASFGFVPAAGIAVPATATQVAVGDFHACAVDAGGELRCWGLNSRGQLGVGVVADKRVPTKIADTPWDDLALGQRHACGVRGGTLSCWGLNDHDQLGSDDGAVGEHRFTPLGVGQDGWSAAAVGETHTCGLRAAGELWCWGNNANSQLGLVGVGDKPPARVGALDMWSGLSVAEDTGCALRPGGARACWGMSDFHQIGNASTATVTAPTTVNDLLGWQAVARGRRVTCGLDTGGALYCWGSDASGQIGDGAPAGGVATSPQMVSGVGAAVQVAASGGQGHVCAIDASTALWCWGYDGNGQLAQGGTAEARPAPVMVAGLGTGVDEVAVGFSHTCARKGAEIYCWGDNHSGQLGDLTFAGRADVGTPIAPGVASWTRVFAAGDTTCALDADQKLWCWGDNTYGVMGDGTGASPAPVLVQMPMQ